MGVIDADAHVIETERTWSFMLGNKISALHPSSWFRLKTASSFGVSMSAFSPTPILVSMSPKSPVTLPMSPRVSLTWTHWASTSKFSIRRFFYGR